MATVTQCWHTADMPSNSKEPICNAGDRGSTPRLGRSHPEEGNGNPLQYACLENLFHGQRTLAAYSPWVTRVKQDSVTKQQVAFLDWFRRSPNTPVTR